MFLKHIFTTEDCFLLSGFLPRAGDVATPQRSAGQAGGARTLLQAGVSRGAAHLRAVLLPTPQQGQGSGQVEQNTLKNNRFILTGPVTPVAPVSKARASDAAPL